MTYKGYSAQFDVDPEAGVIHGEVLHLRDVITFSVTDAGQLRKAFEDSVDDYLTYCAERGEEPERPFNGKVLLRLEPAVHRDATVAAASAGQSLNAWLATAVKARLELPLAADNPPM